MSKEVQIFVTCSTHPQLTKPRSINVSRRHEYAPPAIEAEIIQNPKRSTLCLKKRLMKAPYPHPNFKIHISEFLLEREAFLTALKDVPEIKSFVNHILGLKADVEKELQMQIEEILLEQALEGEVEEKAAEVESILEKRPERRVKDYDNILDALTDAIRKEKKTDKAMLRNEVIKYVKAYLSLVNWLIEQRLRIKELQISTGAFRQLIAELLVIDVVYISEYKDKLGTEKSIAIPLDISPLRIALVHLLSDDNVNTSMKNWNRLFHPPLFILWKDDILRLAKPYRTLDKHPIMIRVPSFDKVPESFLEEVVRSIKDFQEDINPLIRRIKGLTPTGKRMARPAFVSEYLSKLISHYVDCNPLSIECLKIMDLGCGNGALLRDICMKLFNERKDLGAEIFLQVILNDLIGDPGRSFRRDSQKEEFANKWELYIWRGDLRDLIDEVHRKGENFDVTLINRVFDIYGGYGIFSFDMKELKSDDFSFPTVATEEIAPYELDNKIITFSGLRSYAELWQAIAFLQNQSIEGGLDTVFLPGVEMNMLRNFFTWKDKIGLDVFKNLVDSAELILVSVFPGSFETLFPLEESDKKKVFHCEITGSNTYSIICLSRNKSLIETIAKNEPSCS